jgi:peptidoglycan/LPS O-acetylase OafA/YrhL
MSASFRTNNFDLIRLAAALQVAIYHSCQHLKVFNDSTVITLLHHVPGVPVFFFVSGFLISRSYESNSVLREYALNRAFRIFPALWVCTILAVGAVMATGYLATQEFSRVQFIAWILGQMSFVQFWNPPFMREFGIGVLNGSLWTISVELQFYVLVPILYRLFGRLGKAGMDRAILVLIPCFAAFGVVFHRMHAGHEDQTVFKLLYVTFLPWFWMFLVGVWAQRNFEFLHGLLARPGRIVACFVVFVACSWASENLLGSHSGNGIDPLAFLPLAAVVFGCAYTLPTLAERLLRRNDISYGVYIYHLPLVNLAMWLGLGGAVLHVGYVLVAAVGLATLSWVFVERPCLRLKRRPLNPLAAQQAPPAH